MSKKSELPSGWFEVEFGDLFSLPGDDIVDGPFGSNLKASEYVTKGIPIARLQNIDRNQFIPKNTQYVTSEKAEELARHTFVPGDILITKLGDPLGKACLAPTSIEKGVLVADVVRARITHPWVDRRFLCYQINADNIVEQFKDQTKGTTRPRVNLTQIRALKARLCPMPEQIHIVEKLEELLTDLEANVDELTVAQKKLVLHRQSLLNAAVDGSLTAQWRTEHVQRGAPIETASQLLARILSERRTRWETDQLTKFKELGKVPSNNWQDKYPEPTKPDIANLPTLPDSWGWATIDQLANVGTGATPLRSNAAYFYKGTIPWVTSGALNKENVSEASEMITDLALNECRLEIYPVGSLLVAMYGEGKTRGKCSELMIPASINQAIAALVLGPEAQDCKAYLKLFLLNSYEKMREQASGGVQPNLNLQIIKSIALPLPPSDEQNEITLLLARQFEQIERQQNVVRFGIKQSASQRTNVLNSAFSGQLCPQAPNDKPASELLELIRSEREVREKQPKIKKVKKDSSMKSFDVDSLRDWFKNQSDEQISFEELRNAIPRDYETLKDFVFQLLDENNPVIEQEFNQKTGHMSLKRVGV